MGLEFIDTQTSTGNDFTEITFADAIDFSNYSEFYCTYQCGTNSSRDITFRVGDSGESGVLTTSTYTYVTTDNSAGSFSNESHSGESTFRVANHPRVDSDNGFSGFIRVFLTRDSSNDTLLSFQSFTQGSDSYWIGGGQNTTTQTDLKYFHLFGGGDDFESGSNISYYKLSMV